MALSKKISFTPRGTSKLLEVPSAYHRVDLIRGTKNNLEISLGVYENSDSAAPIWSETYSFVPEMTDVNFIEQAYVFLKTLESFENAVDC